MNWITVHGAHEHSKKNKRNRIEFQNQKLVIKNALKCYTNLYKTSHKLSHNKYIKLIWKQPENKNSSVITFLKQCTNEDEKDKQHNVK